MNNPLIYILDMMEAILGYCCCCKIYFTQICSCFMAREGSPPTEMMFRNFINEINELRAENKIVSVIGSMDGPAKSKSS